MAKKIALAIALFGLLAFAATARGGYREALKTLINQQMRISKTFSHELAAVHVKEPRLTGSRAMIERY
jgi:hypothetical protein